VQMLVDLRRMRDPSRASRTRSASLLICFPSISARIASMEAALGRWNIDGVEFDVETAWGLTVARGRFDRVAGSYQVGPEGTQIELTLDARSMVTENRMWDDLLRSNELAGIAEHPEVRFKSTGVTDSGQGKLHVEGRFEATGKVVPVAFDAVVHRVDRGLQMDVTARVDEQQVRKSSAQLRLILPATVHVKTRLSDSRTPIRADSA
jgi:polyisoprenoid-binding protein YceI